MAHTRAATGFNALTQGMCQCKILQFTNKSQNAAVQSLRNWKFPRNICAVGRLATSSGYISYTVTRLPVRAAS